MERVESADWAPDGSLAITYHDQAKARLEFPVGTLRYESATWISHVRVSPKGDMVAFIDHDDPIGDGGVVRVLGSNLNAPLTRDYEQERVAQVESKAGRGPLGVQPKSRRCPRKHRSPAALASTMIGLNSL